MPNTLGIIEATTAEAADISDVVNSVGDNGVAPRDFWSKNATIRITDHPADEGVTGDEKDQMALFTSKSLHMPWILGGAKQGLYSKDEEIIFPV